MGLWKWKDQFCDLQQTRRTGSIASPIPRKLTAVVHRLGESLLALFQHLGVDVKHLHMGLAIRPLLPSMVQQANGDITRPAGDVEALHPSVRVHLLDVVVLPEAVDAQRHGIVHHVVAGGDRGEDAFHF